MFSEILKIIPRIDNGALNNMERSLSSRFARVAKKFGGGLVSAIKGGAITGAILGLVSKILNPLEEVQAAIDKTLTTGDDLSTFAKQFNTTAGNLARLQAFGKATGLDPEGVRTLLLKFQGAVAQAALKPGEPTAVSKFVGRKDTAEAFFEFVQSMQKLNPTQKTLVQTEVFGEKQILKASEFLEANFKELNAKIGGPSSDQLTAAAQWLGQMKDNLDLAAAQRDLTDLPKKASLIGDPVINAMNRAENLQLAHENRNLTNYDHIKSISTNMDKLYNLLQDFFVSLSPVLAKVLPQLPATLDQLANEAGKVGASRVIRGMIPGQGKDK